MHRSWNEERHLLRWKMQLTGHTAAHRRSVQCMQPSKRALRRLAVIDGDGLGRRLMPQGTSFSFYARGDAGVAVDAGSASQETSITAMGCGSLRRSDLTEGGFGSACRWPDRSRRWLRPFTSPPSTSDRRLSDTCRVDRRPATSRQSEGHPRHALPTRSFTKASCALSLTLRSVTHTQLHR